MRKQPKTRMIREIEVSFKSPDTLDIERFKAFDVIYRPGEPRILYDRNGTGYPGSPAEVEWKSLVRLTTETVEDVPVEASAAEEHAAIDPIRKKIESLLAD